MNKILLITSLLFTGIVYADVPENQKTEVEYLLNFVKNSHYTINRNGTQHNGKESSKHIEKKYNYFEGDIKNTEDFIKHSATKSTLSGEYYMVSCTNKKIMKAQQWLLHELNNYRRTHTANNSKPKITLCTNPRPQVCTMQYLPVCASLQNNHQKTYASACSACADKNVISHSLHKC